MANNSIDRYVANAGPGSGGTVSRRTLLEAGVRSNQIHRCLEEKTLVRVSRGIYEFAAAEGPMKELRRSKVTSPRSVVSHESAAELHGIAGFRPSQPTITVPSHTTHRVEGVAVRRNDDRLSGHTEVKKGVLVTTLLRTIFDLSYQIGYEETVKLLDRYRVLGAITLGDIERIAAQLCRRGKPGSAYFRRYLKEQTWRGPLPRISEPKSGSISSAEVIRILKALGTVATLPWAINHFMYELQRDLAGLHRGHDRIS